MFGAIAGGIASALAGGAMSKLFGGGQKAASGGIQGDMLATDNNTVGMGDAGIKSAIQGSNVPNPDEAVPSFVSGAMAKAGKGLLEGTLQAGTSAVSDKLLDFLSLMRGSVLVLMLPLLVWLTPDLRIKKSLLKCNWTIRKRLPRCKMRLKKRLLAFSRRLHARIRKTRYMHKMRCLLINRRSLLLALRLLWKTPIFPSNSRFPRLCAKCLLKLKRLVSILPMTKSKK